MAVVVREGGNRDKTLERSSDRAIDPDRLILGCPICIRLMTLSFFPLSFLVILLILLDSTRLGCRLQEAWWNNGD